MRFLQNAFAAVFEVDVVAVEETFRRYDHDLRGRTARHRHMQVSNLTTDRTGKKVEDRRTCSSQPTSGCPMSAT